MEFHKRYGLYKIPEEADFLAAPAIADAVLK
jgi:hypothetical protein